ncbi:hypothetical protein FHS39_000568 [Streptomyces olivoverticillatus]|uniref:Albusnodin family lasso peptide n=1 Tax=Streptomyces olivoverticillatus TaxID=66427 RepID=A0A7W7LKX9_9ACTN|nr:albusnodin family lasso peptide [Streptomyces olivoverticillatus]MBB4891568.1 hypothetical protein [Streptomyces olivoverticillatus]
MTHHDAPALPALPTVIDLGDAAELTKGNENESVESKQEPYS